MYKSIVLLSDSQNRCVTFFRPDDMNNYVGYRFWEGEPETIESSSTNYERQPLNPIRSQPVGEKRVLEWDESGVVGREWLGSYREADASAGGRLLFRGYADGSAQAEILNYAEHLSLELYFEPDETGIQLWLKARTTRTITGGYCLQQCLRFTGAMNEAWRTKIAHVPYLSEFDMHAMGRPNATLTYGRKGGGWSQLPVEHTVVPTNALDESTAGATAAAFDHGLIVRESPHRLEAPQWYWDRVAPGVSWDQIAAGLYWERTAMVSNRHPADCLHAWLDIGPLAAGESRLLRGKVYYLEGSKDDLLAQWRQEFSST